MALGACIVAAIIFVLMVGFTINGDEQTLKIGLVIDGEVHDSESGTAHHEGMQAACDEFGIELLVRDNVEDLIENDVGMIFLASSPPNVRDI